eukprot:1172234-Prorocentrum_minimum.AAC.1
MAKNQEACDTGVENCDKTEFLEPYLKPYHNGVAKYNKKVANYVSEGYCKGQCGDSPSTEEKQAVTDFLCKAGDDANCKKYIDDFKGSWLDDEKVLKNKRLPAYITFSDSDAYGDAIYHYACPLEGGCDDVQELWNRTSNTLMEAAATAAASPAEQ